MQEDEPTRAEVLGWEQTWCVEDVEWAVRVDLGIKKRAVNGDMSKGECRPYRLYRAMSRSLDTTPSIMGGCGGDSGDMTGFMFSKDPFDHAVDSEL